MGTEIKGGKGKLVWMEYLRIVSAFAVVLLHIVALRIKDWTVYEDYYVPLAVYHALVRFAVNGFLMITGALMLRPDKEITVEKIVKKYVPKVLILFIFWSAAYAFATYFPDVMAGKTVNARTVVNKLIMGHYHLWYLYMLAGLYLLLPFLREIAKNKKLTEYFLILGMILYLLPNFLQILAPTLSSTLKTVIDTKMLSPFVKGYSVVYCLAGFYLTYYEIKPWLKKMIYICGTLGIVYGAVGGVLFSRAQGSPTQLTYNTNTLNIAFYSAAVFLFFFSVCGKKRYSERKNKIICKLGECSLGVYLLHPFFVDRLTVPVFELVNYKCMAVVPVLLALGIVVVCVLITLVLKKIPVVGKYLV